jgi:hypothetical protein
LRFWAGAVVILSGWLLAFTGCQTDLKPAGQSPRFTLLDASQTGINFRNDVPYTDSFNCYLFRNFYNGGGVGIGDINNDGLPDIFLCGNMTSNRLYLNRGNFKFEDITEKAGLGARKVWTAGVAFADVNGDGRLDIYTCKSGPPGGENRHNELFINNDDAEKNNGIPTFTEQSAAWGLDNRGLSTHAAFFDYDRDGDLDCYLLNNSLRSVGGYDYRPGQRNTPDPEGGNKLLRNDGPPDSLKGGGFTDVTRQAGMYSSAIGFGLGVTVGDYDRDGWQDLYISNDFFERDYLYHNNGDGTFSEVLEKVIPEISKGSMGADMADLNNDGFPEIFVTEMTPHDDARYKTKTAFDDWNTYQTMLETGYHRQFGRNVLQLNHGGRGTVDGGRSTVDGGRWTGDAETSGPTVPRPPSTVNRQPSTVNRLPSTVDRPPSTVHRPPSTVHRPPSTVHRPPSTVHRLPSTVHRPPSTVFSEIGRQAGVWATDWSWGALLADFDNDGWKDIFVANGIGKDLLDQDYLNFYSDAAAVSKVLREHPGQGIKTLIDGMPSEPIANCLFQNQGDLTFRNQAAAWGLAQPSFSNGSAYGDLDNDGDLDLVVNNVNMPCFVYRNETIRQGEYNPDAHWLRVTLVGEDSRNPYCLGAKVTVTAGGQTFYQELAPMRGFESCVDPRLHFGLGKNTKIDTLRVEFSSGRVWETYGLEEDINREIQILEGDTKPPKETASTSDRPAQTVFQPASGGPDFLHRESVYSDFDREPLLFRMYSAEGPKMAVADVNGDGCEDFYIGGAAGQAGQLFVQTANGRFAPLRQPDFEKDKIGEDVAAAFFDADGDGDPDLYVGSGSNEFEPGAPGLDDRLYLNDGRGRFQRRADALPSGKPFATACVAAADVDGDGDQDLFVGMRLVPGHYGQPPTSFLLENDGAGYFKPANQRYPALNQLGMVTAAVWTDLDGDRYPELIVAGDWEPVHIFKNTAGKLSLQATVHGNAATSGGGWWNCIATADLDGDGDPDFVLGNQGLNSRFKAGAKQPLQLYVNDFDQNGRDETILCQYNGSESYPVVMRNDLVKQLPVLKKKYLKFNDYKNQAITQIFTPEQLRGAVVKETVTLETAILWNRGQGKFELEPLPYSAQIAPVFAVAVADFDADGHPDILLGGNEERCKPETGICLASRGVLLRGDGKGKFAPVPVRESGLQIEGVVRDFAVIGNRLLVARNNRGMVMYGFGKVVE